MQRKNVIYFVKTSPFDMPQAREDLDLILMLASFEVNVSLIFINAGVLQLKPTQAEAINARAYSNILASLPHYDITQLYALDSDMTKYHVHQAHTILPVTCINEEKISRLLTHADYIF